MLATANSTPVSDRPHEGQKACWQRQDKGLAETGKERDPAQVRRELGDKRERQRSGPRVQGPVCPGCQCSGVRGGVRYIGGGPATTHGEQQTKHDDTQDAVSVNNINQAALCTEENFTGGDVEMPVTRPGECSKRQESPRDISSCTDCVAVGGGTFRTSLGVVVDICTWRQKHNADVAGAVLGDRSGEHDECSTKCGENTAG